MVWKPSHRREMQDGTRKFNFKLKANVITKKGKHVKSAPHVKFIIMVTACRLFQEADRRRGKSAFPVICYTTITVGHNFNHVGGSVPILKLIIIK